MHFTLPEEVRTIEVALKHVKLALSGLGRPPGRAGVLEELGELVDVVIRPTNSERFTPPFRPRSPTPTTRTALVTSYSKSDTTNLTAKGGAAAPSPRLRAAVTGAPPVFMSSVRCRSSCSVWNRGSREAVRAGGAG